MKFPTGEDARLGSTKSVLTASDRSVSGLENQQLNNNLDVDDDDDGPGFSLAYDDGILPSHVPSRDQVPEIEFKLLPKLHVAARDGHVAVIKAILKTETEPVNIVDPAYQTALHFACGGRIGEQGEAPAIEVIKILLQNGADCNKKDATGSTPLHNAVRSGRLEAVRVLLEWSGSYAVNVNVSDVHMDTPLHLAVKLKRIEITRILVEHGAIATVLNLENLTPPLIAKEINCVELIDMFLSKFGEERVARANELFA